MVGWEDKLAQWDQRLAALGASPERIEACRQNYQRHLSSLEGSLDDLLRSPAVAPPQPMSGGPEREPLDGPPTAISVVPPPIVEEVAAEQAVPPMAEQSAAEVELATVSEVPALDSTAELGESDRGSVEVHEPSAEDVLSSMPPEESQMGADSVSSAPPAGMPEPPLAEVGPPQAVPSSHEPTLSVVQSAAGEPEERDPVSVSPAEKSAVEERYPRIDDEDDDEFSGLMALDARRNLEVGDLTSGDPTQSGESLYGFADVEDEATLVVEIPNEA